MSSAALTTTIKQRCCGAMLGLAAADRNGGPQRMAMRMAESALLSTSAPWNTRETLRSYMKWAEGPRKYSSEPESAFDTGQAFAMVMHANIRSCGGNFDLLTDEMALANVNDAFARTNSAGVNPAHRNILALCVKQLPALSDLVAASKKECSLTHVHVESVQCSVAAAVVTRVLLLGGTLLDGVLAALEHVRVERGRDELTVPVLKSVADALSAPSSDNSNQKNMKPPTDRGGRSPLVLYAALYFVANTESFDKCLKDSIAFAGAANYCPVLVGSIGGALYGVGGEALQKLATVGMNGCEFDGTGDDEKQEKTETKSNSDRGVKRAHLDHREFSSTKEHVARYMKVTCQLADALS